MTTAPRPTLRDLPSPPADRRGWPWTEGDDEGAARQSGTSPLISVVVPSYQQAAFLEETLRSVLLQGYPNLELLVMDGGSTDSSVEIIRRYEPWITAWVSERDGGQSAAINKGWRRARGEFVTWLNSDDLLLRGWADCMVREVVRDGGPELAYCDVSVIDSVSRPQWVFEGRTPSISRLVLYWRTPFAQQGFLMRRALLEKCGYVDERLHYAMDTEFWLRLMLAGTRMERVHRTLAAFRLHEAAKTATLHPVLVDNLLEVTERFCETAPPDLSSLATAARKRRHWNAAHAAYDGGRYAAARRYAFQHLADAGVAAAPRVAAMLGLTLTGRAGRRALDLLRRMRGDRAP